MKIYHVETQESYDELMIELEEKGYKWLSGHKPTSKDYWEKEKENTCIKISGKDITFRSFEQLKEQHQNTPVIEYKAKGENMLNIECKQCHKKCHHEKSKYCAMCGNKLVDEPEFKVDDYVKNDSWIGKVEQKGMNILIGSFYDKKNNKILSNFYAVDCDETQHAIPEEIAEYESALNFHKHGRNPFELREGDIISYSESDKIFVDVPSFWDKEDFTGGDYTLLKTAEEFKEWIENK